MMAPPMRTAGQPEARRKGMAVTEGNVASPSGLHREGHRAVGRDVTLSEYDS